MSDDLDKLARGLSKAQKDALFGRYSWLSPWEQEDGERELYRLGLWGPHGGRSELAATLRNHIMKENADEQ